MRTLKLSENTKKDLLNDLLKRSPNNYGQYETVVADIIAQVREKGDEAVLPLPVNLIIVRSPLIL